METGLTVAQETTTAPSVAVKWLQPVISIEDAVRRHNELVGFVAKMMVKGIDYGAPYPGSEKSTLLKPGAETLSAFFGLHPHFTTIRFIEDWTGADHGGEALFYYFYKCVLTDSSGNFVAEGDGSANSWNKKYRYRQEDKRCPTCGEAALMRSKYPPRDNPGAKPGWYCNTRRNGCGANFAADEPAIVNQPSGQIINKDIFDQVNTMQKMAQKSSFIAAVLMGCGASEFFAQDIEDMFIEGTFTATSEHKGDAGASGKAPESTATKPEPEREQAPRRTAPISNNQRNKLIELYIERFGGTEDEAIQGLDAIFESSFKHPLGDATLAEASKIISMMIEHKSGRAKATATAPASTAITNAEQLLTAIERDQQLGDYYAKPERGASIYHLQGAIRLQLANPKWAWPRPNDAAEWKVALDAAMQYAKDQIALSKEHAAA